MINPLLVATNGYLSLVSNSTLSVAVDGYLLPGLVPPSPPYNPDYEDLNMGGGLTAEKIRIKRQRDEDEELLLFILNFFKWL